MNRRLKRNTLSSGEGSSLPTRNFSLPSRRELCEIESGDAHEWKRMEVAKVLVRVLIVCCFRKSIKAWNLLSLQWKSDDAAWAISSCFATSQSRLIILCKQWEIRQGLTQLTHESILVMSGWDAENQFVSAILTPVWWLCSTASGAQISHARIGVEKRFQWTRTAHKLWNIFPWNLKRSPTRRSLISNFYCFLAAFASLKASTPPNIDPNDDDDNNALLKLLQQSIDAKVHVRGNPDSMNRSRLWPVDAIRFSAAGRGCQSCASSSYRWLTENWLWADSN